MRLLIDTNVFLEMIYKQPQAVAARALLESDAHQFYISDFALHSIGVSLLRRGRASRWADFIAEMILSGRVGVLTRPYDVLPDVTVIAQRFNLDFDDAYQYVVAEYNDLIIVSFDGDFDHTRRGRQTPPAINQLTATQNSSDQQ